MEAAREREWEVVVAEEEAEWQRLSDQVEGALDLGSPASPTVPLDLNDDTPNY